MTTFESAKVGDKVWSFTKGWGTVCAVITNNCYGLYVKFDNTVFTFTFKGYHHIQDKKQTIFWDEVKVKAPEKPTRTKLIHGFEVPDIAFKPIIVDGKAVKFYTPEPTSRRLFDFLTLDKEAKADAWLILSHYIDNDLCYPYTKEGKEAAILHAKAMLGSKE